ncbi:hypothetical protein GCM10009551_016220 [Nocardiopsis tropica]
MAGFAERLLGMAGIGPPFSFDEDEWGAVERHVGSPLPQDCKMNSSARENLRTGAVSLMPGT